MTVVQSRRKHPQLFTYWLTLVALAFFAPRFFPPPPGVDLAPAAGLVFLFFVLCALGVAVYAFIYTMRIRSQTSTREIAMGLSPLVLTTAFLTWLVVWVAL